MDKKYELTDETIMVSGHTLYRIKALRYWGWGTKYIGGCVDKGSIGGWIESECNLSHDGGCWIHNEAMVFGNAKVYGDAYVGDSALIYDNAQLYGNCLVYDDSQVFGNANVFEKARVCKGSCVYGNAHVCGNAWVYAITQLNRGIWNTHTEIDKTWYLLSTTLQKMINGGLE